MVTPTDWHFAQFTSLFYYVAHSIFFKLSQKYSVCEDGCFASISQPEGLHHRVSDLNEKKYMLLRASAGRQFHPIYRYSGLGLRLFCVLPKYRCTDNSKTSDTRHIRIQHIIGFTHLEMHDALLISTTGITVIQITQKGRLLSAAILP